VRAIVIGAGYVGIPLAAELVRRGHEVSTLRRSSIGDAELKAAGVQPLLGDITDLATLKKLPANWDWVINTVSSSRGGLKDYEEVYLGGTKNLVT